MSRKLVWIEQQRFRGFGCSECGWRLKPTETLAGPSFNEMMRNFELQRDTPARTNIKAPPARRPPAI